MSAQQINLFNPLLSKKKLAFSALEMSQMLGLVVLGVIAITWYLSFQVSLLEKQLATSKEQLKVAQAQLGKVAAEYVPRAKNKQLETDIAATEAQVKALEKVADLLKRGDFGNAHGYSSYLKAFARESIDGLWLTNVAIGAAGNDISLTGRTLQPALVPQYVQRLASETALQGKSFSALDMQRLSTEAAATPGSTGGTNTSANTSTNTAAVNTAAAANGAAALAAAAGASAQPGNGTSAQDAAALLGQINKLGAPGLTPLVGQLLKTSGLDANGALAKPVPGVATLPPAGNNAGNSTGSTGSSNSSSNSSSKLPGNANAANSGVIEFTLSTHAGPQEHK
jgi:hypothetical protein